MRLPHRPRSLCIPRNPNHPSLSLRATMVSVSSTSAFTRLTALVHLPRRRHLSAPHRHSCRTPTRSWSRSSRRHNTRSSVFVSSSRRCQSPASHPRRSPAERSSGQGDVARSRTTEAVHTTAGRTTVARPTTTDGRMSAAMWGARSVSPRACHYRWSSSSRWVCSSPRIYSSKVEGARSPGRVCSLRTCM